jgi:hypothetical protein
LGGTQAARLCGASARSKVSSAQRRTRPGSQSLGFVVGEYDGKYRRASRPCVMYLGTQLPGTTYRGGDSSDLTDRSYSRNFGARARVHTQRIPTAPYSTEDLQPSPKGLLGVSARVRRHGASLWLFRKNLDRGASCRCSLPGRLPTFYPGGLPLAAHEAMVGGETPLGEGLSPVLHPKGV